MLYGQCPYDILFALLNHMEPLVERKLPLNKTEKLILAIIVVPLFETLLFQTIPYRLLSLNKYLKNIILISAILIARWHPYSWLYVIYTFLGGSI